MIDSPRDCLTVSKIEEYQNDSADLTPNKNNCVFIRERSLFKWTPVKVVGGLRKCQLWKSGVFEKITHYVMFRHICFLKGVPENVDSEKRGSTEMLTRQRDESSEMFKDPSTPFCVVHLNNEHSLIRSHLYFFRYYCLCCKKAW